MALEELELPTPSLPEPDKPASKGDEDQYDIEIVDDTPEPDRGKAPPSQPPEQLAGKEEEDENFAPDAKKRIKQLRYVYHEERRNKEQAKREADAAVEYARSLLNENQQLKGQLSTGERVLVEQAKGRAEAQVAMAKSKYLSAHENGDAAAMASAQEEMARAVSDHQRFLNYVPSTPPTPPPPQYQPGPPQGQPTQQQKPVDQRTQAWFQKNQWYGAPGYEEPSNFALGVHQRLLHRGVSPDNPDTADEYWSTVENRLATVFPEQFGAVFGQNGQAANGNPNLPPGRTQARPSQPQSRPVVAAGGARKSPSPIKVRLTQSQVALAQRLGLTTEQYAKAVAKQQAQEGR